MKKNQNNIARLYESPVITLLPVVVEGGIAVSGEPQGISAEEYNEETW